MGHRVGLKCKNLQLSEECGERYNRRLVVCIQKMEWEVMELMWE